MLCGTVGGGMDVGRRVERMRRGWRGRWLKNRVCKAREISSMEEKETKNSYRLKPMSLKFTSCDQMNTRVCDSSRLGYESRIKASLLHQRPSRLLKVRNVLKERRSIVKFVK